MAKSIVLWCDSCEHVGESASLLTKRGIDVHTFSDPEELLNVYAQLSHQVVGVISSMMGAGAMNAFDLFAACRCRAYESGARPSVFVLVSHVAEPAAALTAGADVVVVTGKRRQRAQELLLAKLRGLSDISAPMPAKRVLWCDSADVSYLKERFSASGYSFENFQNTTDLLDAIEAHGDDVAAIFTSSMESDDCMNAFELFASARAMLQEASIRPLFVAVSASLGTADCYKHGADIAACRDNELRKERYKTGRFRDHAISDFLSLDAGVTAKEFASWREQGTLPESINLYMEACITFEGPTRLIEVRNFAGECLYGPVNLPQALTVAELKDKISKAMGRTGGMQLSLRSECLLDEESIACLEFDVDGGEFLQATFTAAPAWYPHSRYVHDGKDVISVHVKADLYYPMACEPRSGTFCVTLLYTDGSSSKFSQTRVEKEGLGRRSRFQEDAETQPALGEGFEDKLIEEWGFKKYITQQVSNEIFGWQTYVAIPPEDPEEWIEIEADESKSFGRNPEYVGAYWVRARDLGTVTKH